MCKHWQCQWADQCINRPCFLLQRALPPADEPDDSPTTGEADALGKTRTWFNQQISFLPLCLKAIAKLWMVPSKALSHEALFCQKYEPAEGIFIEPGKLMAGKTQPVLMNLCWGVMDPPPSSSSQIVVRTVIIYLHIVARHVHVPQFTHFSSF